MSREEFGPNQSLFSLADYLPLEGIYRSSPAAFGLLSFVATCKLRTHLPATLMPMLTFSSFLVTWFSTAISDDPLTQRFLVLGGMGSFLGFSLSESSWFYLSSLITSPVAEQKLPPPKLLPQRKVKSTQPRIEQKPTKTPAPKPLPPSTPPTKEQQTHWQIRQFLALFETGLIRWNQAEKKYPYLLMDEIKQFKNNVQDLIKLLPVDLSDIELDLSKRQQWDLKRSILAERLKKTYAVPQNFEPRLSALQQTVHAMERKIEEESLPARSRHQSRHQGKQDLFSSNENSRKQTPKTLNRNHGKLGYS